MEISRRGLTLMELLVSIAILVIMILGFSRVLSQSQRVTSTATAAMRSNASAAAIVDVIRNDIRMATQNGFLCIATKDLAGTPVPVLIVTKAGVSPSKTGSDVGTGSFVCLSLAANSATSTNDILWHPEWILASSGSAGDVWSGVDLATLQTYSLADIEHLVDDIVDEDQSVTLSVPASSLAELGNLWHVLTTDCSDLTIEWTDGDAPSGNLEWYHKDNVSGEPFENGTSGSTYRALWTKDDQTNWPKAIKINFEIDGLEYEVICPVGQ
ncbi:MAG: prepilin-type N-terminal cleavage/methylation domain-containing protein [Planctomycetota bacterium]|nr:prepilin-type N-terminal cleavage/methylation domain-containing protein [Planctomycetota bacterium]